MSLIFTLSGCQTALDRLNHVGDTPQMHPIENAFAEGVDKKIEWPEEDLQTPQPRMANSLWQHNSRYFFQDQKARRIGDILKVKVKFKDKAELNNQSTRNRTTKETLGAPNILGLDKGLTKLMPGKQDLTSLLDISGSNNNLGNGAVKRGENLETEIAALVTQILPNGNLVIRGKQEVRINFEVREITIDGIVRPDDISSENSVGADQIAEARISYGGRGQITDVQQPRYGTQLLDIIAPF
ncbi:MAG: flagellar basal body L-ring protein FlgH [Alphaproteobacteria bacterium]|nr:flagellar basal body L-ring protein FlgH [Alphaproteobacteria bacterium]